jgi:acyl-CoA reductase-like NAD-dependent aldehyde dehydrogenase
MSALPRYELHVGGRSVPAASGRTYETVDPYSGRPWAVVADAGAADVDAAVGAARRSSSMTWTRSPCSTSAARTASPPASAPDRSG